MRHRGVVIDEDGLELLVKALEVFFVKMRNCAGNDLVHAQDRISLFNGIPVLLVRRRFRQVAGRPAEWIDLFTRSEIGWRYRLDRQQA